MAIPGLLGVSPSSDFQSNFRNRRSILNREPPGGRAFPYQNIWTDNNTVEACLNQCAAFGYPAAGLEVRFDSLSHCHTLP